jgi:cytidylate kinase
LYIDTGAMYRAFTWEVLQRHVDIADPKSVQILADTIQIRLEIGREQCRVYVNQIDVTDAIRTSEVSSHVSAVAALAVVRQKLVQLQREMATSGGVILDGRDIGTVVLPDADVKIFLTASVHSRAMRRYLEVRERNERETLEHIEAAIASRDYMDSHRDISPLKQADDAILLDNSELNLEETAAALMKIIEARRQ